MYPELKRTISLLLINNACSVRCYRHALQAFPHLVLDFCAGLMDRQCDRFELAPISRTAGQRRFIGAGSNYMECCHWREYCMGTTDSGPRPCIADYLERF